MKKSSAGCLLLLFLGLAAKGQAQTVALPAVADTYLRSGAPNQNQGSEAFLRVQQSGNNRSLVRFDSAAIATAVGSGSLASARLELYIQNNSNNWGSDGRTVDAHRLTASWSESGATWNCGIDSNPGNGNADCNPQWAGGQFAEEPSDTVLHTNGLTGWISFDVTADVRAVLSGTANHGWIVKKTEEGQNGQADYTSRQGAADHAPRLILTVESTAFDQVPPSVAITAPSRTTQINEPSPTVTVAYADGGSGIDTGSFQLLLDGQDATASCTAGASSATCHPATLAAGAHTLQAKVRDHAGNLSQASFSFQLLLGAGPHLVTLQAMADTYLRKGGSNQNQGTDSILRVQQSGSNRTLLQFDLQSLASELAGATLVSAALELHVEQNGRNWGSQGRTVDVHRLTSAWTETGATWSCPADTNPSNSQPDCAAQWNGGSFAPAPTASVLHTKDLTGWVSFDVTADVAAFTAGTTNYGWLVKKTNEGQAGRMDYDSRQGTAGEGPRLVVVFETLQGTNEAPRVTITTPTTGTLTNLPLIEVRGTVTDDGAVASLTVNGDPVTLVAGAFATRILLPEGESEVVAVATDTAGEIGSARAPVVLDSRPPEIVLSSPPLDLTTNAPTVRVSGQVTDERGVAAVEINGQPVPLTGADFARDMTLADGINLLTLRATDPAGNVSQVAVEVRRFSLPEVAITSPTEFSTVAATAVDVHGMVGGTAQAVMVNGIPATFSGSSFMAPDVPLVEGGNVLTVTVTDLAGHVATDSVSVVRDLTPPKLAIYEPVEGAAVFEATVAVRGLVNDIVAGTVNASEATVTVNGQPAQVANRSFLLPNLTLEPGENVIQVEAIDEAGNRAQAAVRVERPAVPSRRIVAVSGSQQSAVINTTLPQPLVAELRDAMGQPIAGTPVIFKVRGNNGSLDGGVRQLAVVSGANGRAQVSFTLGSRAGIGNQVVEAFAVGFLGPTAFLATALPSGSTLIVVDSGGSQVGVVGRELPRPLVATVTDAGFNRLPDIPVRFRVAAGGGRFENGLADLVAQTDSDGRAIVPFLLGPEEGIENNIVEATVEGLADSPVASFVSTGWTAGDPTRTAIRGVVLDNTNLPLQGVTLRIKDGPQIAQTDAQGQFRIDGAPVGTVYLIVDGSTVERPGSWPDLEYVLTTIPGRENTVGMPIYLLPLDLAHGVLIDETHGGTITLPDVPGFSVEIAPGSVTFPNGSRSGVVSATAVHTDKVPMVTNFGQQPRFIFTLQPPGARFDPPAKVSLPNIDALAPGQVTELYSFDHDLGHFVSIGPATVSEDGTVIVANPGVGILKGGWQCGGDPSGGTGAPHDCPQCQRCNPGRNECEADPAQQRCDDKKQCTFNDKCTGKDCKGTSVEVEIVEAPAVVCVPQPGDPPLQQNARATVNDPSGSITWSGTAELAVNGNGNTATVTGRQPGIGTLFATERRGCDGDEALVEVVGPQSFVGPTEYAVCLPTVIQEAANPPDTPPGDLFLACLQGSMIRKKIRDWQDGFTGDCRLPSGAYDAAGHARNACELFTNPITRPYAEEFLRLHENDPHDPCWSHQMDLNNNERGLENGKAGRDCTAATLADLNAGRLQMVNPPPPGINCP